jgi:LysM repeat protein
LGFPGNKQVRFSSSNRLRVAAAPALIGVAAAITLSVQFTSGSAPASAIHGAKSAHGAGASGAELTSELRGTQVQRPAAKGAATATAAAAKAAASASKPAAKTGTYKVRSGDSLAKIAGKVYHDSKAWPVLFYANKDKVHWANDISVGQVLKVPAKPAHIPAPPKQLGPSAPAPAAATSAPSAPTYTTAEAAPAAQQAATYSGSGSFQSCVISRESGGNSQVMNGSGHYGLYQFSASTWAAYGGNPADFGNASVSEQNTVFNNAIAAGGQSNWSAYDGC